MIKNSVLTEIIFCDKYTFLSVINTINFIIHLENKQAYICNKPSRNVYGITQFLHALYELVASGGILCFNDCRVAYGTILSPAFFSSMTLVDMKMLYNCVAFINFAFLYYAHKLNREKCVFQNESGICF